MENGGAIWRNREVKELGETCRVLVVHTRGSRGGIWETIRGSSKIWFAITTQGLVDTSRLHFIGYWAWRALVSSALILLLEAGKLFTSMSSSQESRISCRSAEILRMLTHNAPGDSGQSLKVGALLGSMKPYQHLNCQLWLQLSRWRNSEPTQSLPASWNQENLTFGQGKEADFLNPSQVRPD